MQYTIRGVSPAVDAAIRRRARATGATSPARGGGTSAIDEALAAQDVVDEAL